MKKTLSTLFTCLLVASLGFAASAKPNASGPTNDLTGKPGDIDTQGKYVVIDGFVLNKLDSNTALLESKYGLIGVQLSGSVPPPEDSTVHGLGDPAGIVKWKGQDLQCYKMSKYTID
jgi:hypothetical protein